MQSNPSKCWFLKIGVGFVKEALISEREVGLGDLACSEGCWPRICVHFMKERNSLKYSVEFSFHMCFGLARSMCCMVSSRKPLACVHELREHTHVSWATRLPGAQGGRSYLEPGNTRQQQPCHPAPSVQKQALPGLNLSLWSVLLVMSIRPAVSELSVFKLNLAESHLMGILCS